MNLSPWSSPVVLVKKKNAEFKFCVHFCRIKQVTRKDSFHMRLASDTLDVLSGTWYFLTLVIGRLNFTPQLVKRLLLQLYEFLVMPFGLTNSGARWGIC